MQILIIAVGKIKEKYLQEGIAEYAKRLRPYVKLNILEIAEEKRIGHLTPSDQKRIKEAEGMRILGAIPQDTLSLSLMSMGFTGQVRLWQKISTGMRLPGRNSLSIIIGGDLGLSDAVIARSTLRLSLSLMTFTHQMIRLILLEQIYRACKINHGEPYHK